MRPTEVGIATEEVCLAKATFCLAGKTIGVYLKHCSKVTALLLSNAIGF
jgi:hypothetical protein